MLNPVSTYRIQFHKDFTLDDFEKIIPYLQKLGIKTVYASPILEAVPGSTHGYDGINPQKINPEIGDEEQLKKISENLKAKGMHWLQDIVPNHMAFHSGNKWLMDVLEKGRMSRYASFFDITWKEDSPIMVPFLGDTLECIAERKELKTDFSGSRLVFRYFDQEYPLNPASYLSVLECDREQPQEVQQVINRIREIQPITDKEAFHTLWEEMLNQFSSWLNQEGIRNYLDRCLEMTNEDPRKILSLAKKQHYLLCHWQETDQRINFRRFFTINGLISLNIQHAEVFKEYHRLALDLLKEGTVHGLRIDHIDGLYDPSAYLQQLREVVGEDTYLVVEKILEPGEELPREWMIQGTTGYDFLSIVNNVLTYQPSEQKFQKYYQALTENSRSIHEQIREKKAFILFNYMGGDLDNLVHTFIGQKLINDKIFTSIGYNTLKKAIAEFLIQCPVYRFYGNTFPLPEEEQAAISEILKRIRESREDLVPAIHVLEDVLLKNSQSNDEHYTNRVAHFYKRCMQFTGPLMAKGVEDTLMYTNSRFIGHNEVGDSPESFGIDIKDFHKQMIKRQTYWPLAINATSTHDTKRGEDASARLNVLTDMAPDWIDSVNEWKDLNKKLKKNNSPDDNDEYFIYQSLVATYPMPGKLDDSYLPRLQEYLTKALREAKRHSNWTSPNEEYEQATRHFAASLLNKKNTFRKKFEGFHKKIADVGILNSLSKVLLKFTCPGVPDTYQGCELWDLSMVDPDNRRPVDYSSRMESLDQLNAEDENYEKHLQSLWKDRYDATIKLWLIHTLLKERDQNPLLFSKGQYIPLEVKGKYKEHILAFARRYQRHWFITVVPLHTGKMCKEQEADLITLDWKNTKIVLPKEAPMHWENVLLKSKGKSQKDILVKDLFHPIPVAVLKLQDKENERGAGILMHITSLPSKFGVGDFGPQARKFAECLSRSGQKYWQLLPLNPTELGNGHSPYSSISSMAGNTLLLSPSLLEKEKLLQKEDLRSNVLPVKAQADFKKAEEIKRALFEKAYSNFKNRPSHPMHLPYRLFCEKEAYWLDDFSLYVVLKQSHQGKPWYEWPVEYKNRNLKALEKFAEGNRNEIDKTKWLQFIFSRQWHELKNYCNELNIQLFGDLPFYISYDSVDVWANPEIFCLNPEGKITGVAGVPPDYFNSDGQLWGMPVFRWDVLKKRNYEWWIKRIKKNMELYDLLRLDHFRAFADYWEVPASEKTAKNGAWKIGPGKDFFDTLKKELGELPFIAEDLGDISEAVSELRDRLKLPGMKVLQFAFGDDLPDSIFIPHNYTHDYVVYSGTHDNNTTVGWYRENAGRTERKNLKNYSGLEVKEKNVHEALARMAYGSVAKIAVLPIQDVLGLDEKARMNLPASTEKNWLWRLKTDQLNEEHEEWLLKLVRLFNRK